MSYSVLSTPLLSILATTTSDKMVSPNLTQVGYSALLVLISIAISRFWKLPVAKDMAIGSVRTFAQLVAVGYALKIIFDIDSAWLIALVLIIMTLVGAHAASGSVREIRKSFPILFLAMSIGSLITIGLMSLLVIPFQASYIIPLGGMIISNSMNAAALSLTRLGADLSQQKLAVESALALGKTWQVATRSIVRESARTGMISILNFMKTVGIVALPGAMTGMILAGAEPLDAVYLQIIVAYMLLMAVTLTSIIAVAIAIRRFFTSYHQLIETDN